MEALLRRLPEHGITGTAALSGTEGTALLDAARDHGWTAVRVDMERAVRPFADLVALRRLRRLAAGHDLVHAHAAKAGALARLALRDGPPVIYAPHGFYFTYHPEGSRPYRRYLALERALASRTAVLHCVSEEERRVAQAYGLGGRSPAVVLQNPVSPRPRPVDRDAVRASLGVSAGERLVVMVARLAPPKDPLTFVRAAALLPHGVRAVLVGDGPLAADARAAAGARVLLTGARDDARDVAAAADVVVLASDSEALPLTLCEAVADGVPVVATDLPGCREAAGAGGVYVPAHDPAALAVAVARLLRDDAARARLAADGVAHARRFDEDRWVDAVVAAYAAGRG